MVYGSITGAALAVLMIIRYFVYDFVGADFNSYRIMRAVSTTASILVLIVSLSLFARAYASRHAEGISFPQLVKFIAAMMVPASLIYGISGHIYGFSMYVKSGIVENIPLKFMIYDILKALATGIFAGLFIAAFLKRDTAAPSAAGKDNDETRQQ